MYLDALRMVLHGAVHQAAPVLWATHLLVCITATSCSKASLDELFPQSFDIRDHAVEGWHSSRGPKHVVCGLAWRVGDTAKARDSFRNERGDPRTLVLLVILEIGLDGCMHHASSFEEVGASCGP